MEWQLDVLVWLVFILKMAFLGMACCFIVSGFDEFFVDVVCLYKKAYHSLFIRRRYPQLSDVQLFAKPEQYIAIMIPCWDESAVIGRMITNTVTVLSYSRYVIFVGTYPNDPKTRTAVEELREQYPNIERIVCPKDGPTSKADCLNWIYEGIKLYEKEHGISFAIIAMNDSEDIVHPWMLKLYNYLIPRVDMVQLPVFPMERAWHLFTAGHYLDEFAENHARDMLVREYIGGAVPSAGVGTAFSHTALNRLAARQNNQVFTIGSLTEDYDLGVRLYEMGARQIFVRNSPVSVEGGQTRKSQSTFRLRQNYVGVREYFPDTFKAAVRQKGRWVAGIALQGWAKIGWHGSPGQIYMLIRDRKSLITNFINLLANILFGCLFLYMLQPLLFPDAYHFPPIVPTEGLFWWIININFFFFFWRMGMRCCFVYGVYGPVQAALSIPRLFWANVINFFATIRAVRLFAASIRTGKPIAWDKTDHLFPSEEALQAYRHRLGDMLLDRRSVSVGELDQALEEQRQTEEPLGEILVRKGVLSEDALLQTLSAQWNIPVQEVDPYAVPPEVIQTVPQATALHYRVFPLELADSGTLLLGVERMPSAATIRELEAELGRPLQFRLAGKGELSFALQRGYSRLVRNTPERPLAAVAAEHHMDTESLASLFRTRRKSYQNIGSILIGKGATTRGALDKAFADYCTTGRKEPFGSYLMQHGLVTQEQLNAALALQEEHSGTIDDIIRHMGIVVQKDQKDQKNHPATDSEPR